MHRRASLTLLVPLLGTALVLSLLVIRPSTAEEPPPPADLKERVQQLLNQLDDTDAGKQTAAVNALIKLGPNVIPFLPERNAKISEIQQKNLVLVRKGLREQMIQHDLTPHTVTIEKDRVPLSKALAELTKQTGVAVVDRRSDGTDPSLRLKLKKATFWQAIDAIAKEADARVSVYQRDGKIALVPRGEGYQTPPTSYNGLFRIAVKRITAVYDLESDGSRYNATLEIAWEPRFRPFMLETKPQSMVIRGEKNQELVGNDMGGGKTAVDGRVAVTIDVPLPTLPRKSQRIRMLKGTLNLIGPTRMRQFNFDTLDRLKADVAACQQTRDEVTVKVQKLEIGNEYWTLEIALDYPSEGPQFESFESWLVYNEIHLKKKNGKQIYPNNGGYNIDRSSGTRALITYHFVDEPSKRLVRGDLADWQLVYKTPGLIAEIPVAFEFKDLPLP